MNRYTKSLILILILVTVAVWIDLPNNPGIHYTNAAGEPYDRDFPTKLGLDLVGGVQALLQVDLPEDIEIDPDSMRTASGIIEKRVNGLGVNEAVVQLAGDRRILVELPGETDPERALETLKQTGLLEFVEVGTQYLTPGTPISTDFGVGGAAGGVFPLLEEATETVAGVEEVDGTATPDAEGSKNTEESGEATPETTEPVQQYHTIMTGANIRSVAVSADQVGNIAVAFELDEEGAKIFGDYTTYNQGTYLAIALDKRIISTPRITQAITSGRGIITGNFTTDQANELAVQLRYGSLPIPLKVVESRTVGPSLGQDSLEKSLIAGVAGLVIVMLFMASYYRLPGAIANLALLVYTAISFALFKVIPVTLTLPGIAGFVLSIGVAVDANILIFERLKEELRGDKPLIRAIDLGWDRAWPSIRDSSISTLITCGVLFVFGSAFGASLVKGFALTLALGIFTSLFTAIYVTRTFLHVVLDNIQISNFKRWFGI